MKVVSLQGFGLTYGLNSRRLTTMLLHNFPTYLLFSNKYIHKIVNQTTREQTEQKPANVSEFFLHCERDVN